MHLKKVLLAVAVAMVVLVGAGVAYAANGSSQTISGEDRGDESYRGSVSAPGQSESSLRQLTNINQAAAELAALKVVPGRVHETELEPSDNGYVVYDIEVAGKDGKSHEVKVDAGNGEILHRDLEDEVDESDAGEREDSE